MFRKTLIKLTLLNTVIVIILIGVLGTAIYLYTAKVLYRSVDHSLKQTIMQVYQGGHGLGRDYLVGVYLWDNKHLIGPLYERSPYDDIIENIPPKKLNVFEDRKISGLYFRVYSSKVLSPQGWVTVEAIKLINPEKETLQRLLLIILIGCGIGLILALGAGFLLAKRALKPIQESWERQQEFVSDASHELRTPLTIIQSRIEMLLKAPQLQIKDKLSDISVTLQETRRLSKLVSNLLTLARSDANQIEIKKDPLILNEIIPEIAEPFIEMAEFQDKEITVEISPNPMTILGDKEKIHQLLVILLDNAMKFTGKNGRITVKGYTEANHAVIKVTDNGIGISKENLSRIFDRFFQADPSRSTTEGTGLGLSIAKWIVNKHNGKISVESEIYNGSTFTVMIPLIPARKNNDIK